MMRGDNRRGVDRRVSYGDADVQGVTVHPPVPFHNVHADAVRVPGDVQPRPFVNTGRLDYERIVILPAPHRVSKPPCRQRTRSIPSDVPGKRSSVGQDFAPYLAVLMQDEHSVRHLREHEAPRLRKRHTRHPERIAYVERVVCVHQADVTRRPIALHALLPEGRKGRPLTRGRVVPPRPGPRQVTNGSGRGRRGILIQLVVIAVPDVCVGPSAQIQRVSLIRFKRLGYCLCCLRLGDGRKTRHDRETREETRNPETPERNRHTSSAWAARLRRDISARTA